MKRVIVTRGSTILQAEHKPETYGVGRVCRHYDCDTILSEYNPEKYCGVHMDVVHEEECEECGTLLPFTADFFVQSRTRKLKICKECHTFIHRRGKKPALIAEEV